MTAPMMAPSPVLFNAQVINRTVVHFAFARAGRGRVHTVKSRVYCCKHDIRGDTKVIPIPLPK